MDILMRIVKVNRGKLALKDDEIEGFLERTVTPIGNSAKSDIPRRYVGRGEYIIVCRK